jgi:hypothetical protein
MSACSAEDSVAEVGDTPFSLENPDPLHQVDLELVQ